VEVAGIESALTLSADLHNRLNTPAQQGFFGV